MSYVYNILALSEYGGGIIHRALMSDFKNKTIYGLISLPRKFIYTCEQGALARVILEYPIVMTGVPIFSTSSEKVGLVGGHVIAPIRPLTKPYTWVKTVPDAGINVGTKIK